MYYRTLSVILAPHSSCTKQQWWSLKVYRRQKADVIKTKQAGAVSSELSPLLCPANGLASGNEKQTLQD